jgi:hypothetical protein
MRDRLSDLVQSIRRLTEAVRGRGRPGQEKRAEPAGWWVLAVGEPLSGAAFGQRDEARERLRASLADQGIALAEHVWVWDESDRVQLVVATLPTQDRAERIAERFRARGIAVRVRREMK